MKYVINQSFNSPEGEYSGPSGRIVDEEFYNKAVGWGYEDRMAVEGWKPATFRTDEELDLEIATLLAEKDRRNDTKGKSVDVEAKTKEQNTETPEAAQKRGRPAKN